MATRLPILLVLLVATSFGGSSSQTGRRELRSLEISQQQGVQMNLRMQPKSIDPSQVIQLLRQPRSGFSSIKAFYPMGEATSKVDKIKVNLDVSSESNDEIVSRIEEMISAWTFLPKENSKSLRVLHFGPEDSKQSYNYFDIKSSEKFGDLLFATVILYISNVDQGGQILFPESEYKMWSDCAKSNNILKPSRGDAILFFNRHPNNTLDRSSFHGRCPVLSGEMWCATKLFYLKGITIEKDTLQSDDADCSDEDENCPRWAAAGECERNSVFMTGSPDYYGTCRKSCNAC
ncbi:probable prolyl 4-hydroxylase 12 isoform X2 [Henckelia pumila]|uniref:probable prolyl 4-hydroxylase 12 isoform X2 n=1 Tax=Henckelia pumila TaxID=405737 RepID=UPI003C6DF133